MSAGTDVSTKSACEICLRNIDYVYSIIKPLDWFEWSKYGIMSICKECTEIVKETTTTKAMMVKSCKIERDIIADRSIVEFISKLENVIYKVRRVSSLYYIDDELLPPKYRGALNLATNLYKSCGLIYRTVFTSKKSPYQMWPEDSIPMEMGDLRVVLAICSLTYKIGDLNMWIKMGSKLIHSDFWCIDPSIHQFKEVNAFVPELYNLRPW